jgi:TldD protein
MEGSVDALVDTACALLDAKPIEPGEYEVICSPNAAGLIVHEAFGHGVELDMFLRNRANAQAYMGKPVAAPMVCMRDGAKSAKHVSSYLFDDEGNMGGDTLIIENGILRAGISDALSAAKLGLRPTGNGKRHSFANKAYSRMTNTFFTPGKDKLDDMIASVKSGYLIESAASGMEDPKDWGIQCMFIYAREIADGKVTGNLVAPVIMTGYVPDLLKAITMVSDATDMRGAGACGKGYKELVKVSSGSPYIKTTARLG